MDSYAVSLVRIPLLSLIVAKLSTFFFKAKCWLLQNLQHKKLLDKLKGSLYVSQNKKSVTYILQMTVLSGFHLMCSIGCCSVLPIHDGKQDRWVLTQKLPKFSVKVCSSGIPSLREEIAKAREACSLKGNFKKSAKF